jgi:ribosomal-protein-alanine N-acetyltransferase
LPAIYLRDYTEADLPALYLLDQACFPPGIAYSQAELAGFLRHTSTFTAIAGVEGELAGRPVGFAVVRPVRRKAAFGRMIPALHVLTIDVDPDVRRQGIGAVDNHVAQRFYDRHGFKRTGTIPGYYNGTTDAYTLEQSCP